MVAGVNLDMEITKKTDNYINQSADIDTGKETQMSGRQESRLLQIGEVARMYHVSVGTLRHYEAQGLLHPEYIDTHTGYRYYSARQLEVLNTIRYLRVLDIPLAQIKDFLANRDVDVIEEKLVKQQELIYEKQRELELISKKIEHRLHHLKDATSSKLDVIQVIELPKERIVWLRDSLQLNSYLDLEYSIQKLQKNQKEPLAFLGKVGVGISAKSLLENRFNQYELVFLMLDEEDEYNGHVDEFEAGKYVSVRFRGSHNEASAYYEKLMTYIKAKSLIIAGFSREITLIDYGLTNNPDKFVTEIRIPVR